MADVNIIQKTSNQVIQSVAAVIDIAATGTVTAGDVIRTGVYIPEGALILRAFYHVHTTFTSAGADAGTLELGLTSDPNEFVVAIAISAAGDVWDAGARGTLWGSRIMATVAGDSLILAAAREGATMVHLTVDEEIICTTATQNITAGKMTVYVEYVQTGKLS